MGSYTYLLRHHCLPCFKIGKADDPVLRSIQIDRAAFNFGRSKIVAVGDSKKARALEKCLHLLFDRFIYRSELLPDDGATEWFDARCFNEVVNFIEGNLSRFGACRVERFPKISHHSGRIKPGPRKFALRLDPPDVRHKRSLSKLAEVVERLSMDIPLWRAHEFRGRVYITTPKPLHHPLMNEGYLFLNIEWGGSWAVLEPVNDLLPSNPDYQYFSKLPGVHYCAFNAGVARHCCGKGEHYDYCCFHRAICDGLGLSDLLREDGGFGADIPCVEY